MDNLKILNDKELENVTGGISESICGFLFLMAVLTVDVILEKIKREEERNSHNMQENIQNATKKVISSIKI